MATTKTSIRLINTEKNNDAGANHKLLKMKISDKIEELLALDVEDQKTP